MLKWIDQKWKSTKRLEKDYRSTIFLSAIFKPGKKESYVFEKLEDFEGYRTLKMEKRVS